MGIEKIDKNFETKSLDTPDTKFYNCLDKKFEINGVFFDEAQSCFLRIPQSVADSTNEGVSFLNCNTAGGRLRFKTDSPFVTIRAFIKNPCKMSHMPLTGSIGFDLFEYKDGTEIYTGTFVPPFDITEEFEASINWGSQAEREFVINFPLYSSVKNLFIGLSKDAFIKKPHPYKISTPVVYYGSSVTQGGCASRPGNSYQAMISRKLDCDYINLGFSGNARGEAEIAEYIAGLEMSAFVFDYDHNAPTADHLLKTHKPMFNLIRQKNPDLPIIIVSAPNYFKSPERDKRFEIISQTYNSAKENGDKNVYLIDGRKIMCGTANDDATVDKCHPNDLGFFAMAQKIGGVLAEIFK